MGLCKCERKKVTNLFCFEHRVNVCEFCLMSDHPKVRYSFRFLIFQCIVKSYLHWLKDSDYASICGICAQELNSGEECVRLMCLGLITFHILNVERRHFSLEMLERRCFYAPSNHCTSWLWMPVLLPIYNSSCESRGAAGGGTSFETFVHDLDET